MGWMEYVVPDFLKLPLEYCSGVRLDDTSRQVDPHSVSVLDV